MPTERQWSEIIQANQAMRECLRQLTEERRIEANDDLDTRLIVAEEQEQKLSTEEIIDMCFLLVGQATSRPRTSLATVTLLIYR